MEGYKVRKAYKIYKVTVSFWLYMNLGGQRKLDHVLLPSSYNYRRYYSGKKRLKDRKFGYL